MSILDNAIADFQAKRGELKKVAVPEWGGDVFFYTAMNVNEKREIFKYFSGEADLEGLVMALVVRARNEDGSKMFTKADRFKLLREVDSVVIERVVTAMGMDIESSEDAEKN